MKFQPTTGEKWIMCIFVTGAGLFYLMPYVENIFKVIGAIIVIAIGVALGNALFRWLDSTI